MNWVSHRLKTLLLVQVAALFLASCGGDGNGEAPQPPPPKPDTTAPTVPANLTGTSPSPTSVELTWTASTDKGAGVAGYRIFRDGNDTPIGTAGATATSYTDNGLSSNTTYNYSILAFDAATPPNVSAMSGSVSVTTQVAQAGDTTPPTIPANVTATLGTPASSQVIVRWSASSDASGISGYRVLRNGSLVTTTTNLTYTDNGLAASTSYSYTIVALDGATPPNASAASTAAVVTTGAAPADTTPPAAPANVNAAALSDTSIRLTWSPSTDASGISEYHVFRVGTQGFTIIAGNASPLAFVDSGLAPNTTYSYQVTALDNSPAKNESALSLAAQVTTSATPPPPDTTAPTAPPNFRVTGIGTTSLTLAWNASTDASGIAEYRVYRNADSSPFTTVAGTVLTVMDTGLTPGTAYTYTIFAVDGSVQANVSDSSTTSATTSAGADNTPPSVPTNLAASALSSSSIRLTWTASTDPSGISGYRIFREGTQIAIAPSNDYTDNGLAASTTYSYAIAAVDASPQQNVSARTGAVMATTTNVPADTDPPTAPTNVMAVAQSSSAIQVTWAASSDASGISAYRVYRNGGATAIATVTGTTLTYTDTALAPSTTYTYNVRAVDGAPGANVSALSTSASATTLATPDITPPTVPTNVVATAQSASSILVSWSASTDDSGIFGYSVFRDGGTTPIAIVQTRTFTDTGLSASTTYTYTIRATDNASPANVSDASAPASATTQPTPPPVDTTPPSVPQNVSAVAQSSTSVLVSWSASTDNASGIASYRVFRNGGSTPIASVGGSTLTFTDTGLTGGVAYTYRVSAVDGATIPNVSAQSTAATATPPDATAPAAPTGVTATAQSGTSILVSWTASTDVSGIREYRVYRDAGATPVGTVASPTTNYTDTGLTGGVTYSYRVRAVDNSPAQNVSALSSAASATTQGAAVSGLDSRPSNTTCLAGDAPSTGTLSIAISRVFPNVTLSDGVKLLQEPTGAQRWFAVQQSGLVRVWANDNAATASTFVNITSRVARLGTESGFLGMAFHPNWPTDPRVYLSYNAGSSGSEVSRISEFRSADGGATLDPASEVILLTVNQPDDNHKGGDIAFGPDGYLYISFGDGGGANDIDPGHNANMGNGQYKQILLGKILRVAIGAQGAPYTIPADNPFAGGPVAVNGSCATANCPEIWTYGMRNPWRWSFDRANGDLWVGDVGQNAWEEVDKLVKGGNYGWRCREGAHASGNSCGSSPGPYLDPVAEYDHSAGLAITGGYVYRGSAIPALVGRYVFADYATGNLWTIPNTTTPTLDVTSTTPLSTGYSVSSFGQGNDGELYIVDYTQGRIGKIVQGAGGGGGRTIPTLLSDTGCVNASNHQQPASGLIPFAPNAPFYSDGAIKQRWMALPNGAQITIENNDDFTFPVGTVLMKNFALGSTPVETRLFMHHNDGSWAGYTYEWNAQGTDATRVIGGKAVTINGQTWEFPSESQCLVCHTTAAGRSLGPEVGSFNGDLLYPATGRTANQLTTHNTIGTLTPALTLPPAQLPLIPNPFGTAPVPDRARAYLHANCSYCHQPGGPTSVDLDLRYTTSLAGTNACDVAPTAGDLGIANARRIAPGDASRSVVVSRVNRLDANMMPPLMRHTIDTAGVQLLSDWINGLTSCN